MTTIFDFTFDKIKEVEQLYKQDKAGVEKKRIVMNVIRKIDPEIDEDLISSLIDLFVKIVKDREAIKIFKKSCKLCF